MNELLLRERHYVGAYWLARGESAESCAQRAETFFRLLAPCDPSFTRWFKKGWTREEALQHRLEPNREEFLSLFSHQKEQSPQDDFSLAVWNGEPDEAASSLSLYCGCASIWVPNLCLINLPDEGAAAERLLQAPVLARVLRAMAVAWEPEWGVATSDTHREMVSESGEVGTFVGHVMYFSRRRGPVPPLHPPVHVEPVEDKGTLVILTPERFSASNPAHVELAQRVTELLAQAGLLGPLQPLDGDSAP